MFAVQNTGTFMAWEASIVHYPLYIINYTLPITSNAKITNTYEIICMKEEGDTTGFYD
jgi:hypothetical protein